MFGPINPLFTRWFDSQPDDVRTAVIAEWNRLGSDPSIAHGWRTGPHARRTALIQWCATNHGYVIT